jgi:hypothetical protein
LRRDGSTVGYYPAPLRGSKTTGTYSSTERYQGAARVIRIC